MVAPTAPAPTPAHKASSVLDSDDSDDDDDDDSDLESVLSEASTNDTTPNTRKIFIPGLPSAATRQDLKGIFAPHGNLSDIKVFNKKRGTRLISCATLIFDDEESVKTILANTPYFFGQFKLDVRENKSRRHKRDRKERKAGKVGKKEKEPKSKPFKQDKKNANGAAAGDSKSSSKENKSELDDNCKLFVGGIPLVATEEELKKIFKDYGTLVEVKLRPPKLATQKFAFAFVTYANKASVAKVLKDRPIKYYNYTNGPTCTVLNVTEHKSKDDSKQNAVPSASSKDSFVLVDKSELGKQPRLGQQPKPSPQPRPQQQQQQPKGPQQPKPQQQPCAPPRQRAYPHMQQGPTTPTSLYPALNEIKDTINTALRNERAGRKNENKDCCVQ